MRQIDGIDYTNAKEAFLKSYQSGIRLFEVDFTLTDEFFLVAQHDEETWRRFTSVEDSIPFTKTNYEQIPLINDYTPLNYQDIVDLLVTYPDVCFVTDSKYTDKISIAVEFSQIVKYVTDVYPDQADNILSRLIPQVYNEDMFWQIMDLYPFKSVILTLYQFEDYTAESIVDFCERTGIKAVTIYYNSLTEKEADLWRKNGIIISVHTIDDFEKATDYFNKYSVNLIYTNCLY